MTGVTVPSMEDYEALSARIDEAGSIAGPAGPAGAPGPAGPAGTITPFIWQKNTGNTSEQFSQMIIAGRINGVNQPIYFYAIYSIQLPEIFEGDLIEVDASFECTQDTGENVMVCRHIHICASATATSGGIEVSESACRNVTPGMHHDHIQDFGSIRGTPAMSNKFVNFIAYANHYELRGHAVKIEPDYGRMTVKVTRAAAMEN